VQSLATGERKTLIDGGGSDARYLPTGHLVCAGRRPVCRSHSTHNGA
jgi:hypothetical protein